MCALFSPENVRKDVATDVKRICIAMWMRCTSRRWNEKVIKFNSLIPKYFTCALFPCPKLSADVNTKYGVATAAAAGWVLMPKHQNVKSTGISLSLSLSRVCVRCVDRSGLNISQESTRALTALSKGVPQIEFEIDLRAKL